MDRTAASQLSPHDSGEKIAFEYALNQLNGDNKLIFFDVGGNDGDYSNMVKDICFSKIEGFELSALKGSHQMLVNKKIEFIQIEIGAASLTTKSMLFDFWKILNDSYCFYLILNQGLIEIKEYKPDLECFYGASNFLLELK
jgi:hypothetical protein